MSLSTNERSVLESSKVYIERAIKQKQIELYDLDLELHRVKELLKDE